MRDLIDDTLISSLKLQAWFLGAVTVMMMIISYPM